MDGDPRFRIVTGKGGVGKSAVAVALALAEARQGKRVLLAEANGGDRCAALLGVEPVGYEMREVVENIHVVDINPKDAVREYALLVLRLEALYKAIFENKLVRHFIGLVPSLGELVTLGKLWFHDQQDHPTLADARRFDVIILDGPATGHAIAMLRAPFAVQRSVPAGPLRTNCRLITEMLQNSDDTVLHVVTTPEEMPVNEAIELGQAASEDLEIRVGRCFINQSVNALPTEAVQILNNDCPPRFAPIAEALQTRNNKVAEGERHLARLPGYMLSNMLRLPRLTHAPFGPAAVNVLRDTILREGYGDA